VCPEGTSPDRARVELCDPTDPDTLRSVRRTRRGGSDRGAAAPGADPAAPGGGDASGGLPTSPDDIRDELEGILDLPKGALDGLGLGKKKGRGRGSTGGGLDSGTARATNDLLDLLFTP
jgi:hypothetical protein